MNGLFREPFLGVNYPQDYNNMVPTHRGGKITLPSSSSTGPSAYKSLLPLRSRERPPSLTLLELKPRERCDGPPTITAPPQSPVDAVPFHYTRTRPPFPHHLPKEMLNLRSSEVSPPHVRSPASGYGSERSRVESASGSELGDEEAVFHYQLSKLLCDLLPIPSHCDHCLAFVCRTRQMHGQPLPTPNDTGIWSTHHATDRNGRVTCPRLAARVCGVCGATGSNAHVNNYCPRSRTATTF